MFGVQTVVVSSLKKSQLVHMGRSVETPPMCLNVNQDSCDALCRHLAWLQSKG